MNIPFFQVDVFADGLFSGNPAGVCLLPEGWLPDELMQLIAFENNISETAFVIKEKDQFKLRWFTPTVEVDLCGHATIAPAHILIREIKSVKNKIEFSTKSGIVSVEANEETLTLDFPVRPPIACETPENLKKVFGLTPQKIMRARDYFLVFENEEEISNMHPDFAEMLAWDSLGVIVTAPGREVDFVSRFFAPKVGVDEDPVTGSAHSTLIPYWAEKLQKNSLRARQLSARGGELFCQLVEDRVKIGGRAVTFLEGKIRIPDLCLSQYKARQS